MKHPLSLYNTLTKKKEQFVPLNPPFVGLYVCGPTVYSEPHLGHIRMAITFDVLFRYLLHLGYKVRYVRNITDVGHLEDEISGEGEDRISKKARIERLEPMEVVQKYKIEFHRILDRLNCKPPSIEPLASGHIIEQLEMINNICRKGYAYKVDKSIYFDIQKYNKKNKKTQYGILSGRKLEELLANTRDLKGIDKKKNPFDFAMWKKADPRHIMQWPSEWGNGFPGWHLECSAMSTKYLGKTFDIHGGGMDLMFPHHECEIAQSVAANGVQPVRYWIHNNMITIDGQKMSRSLNNFITLKQVFDDGHPRLTKKYTPMTVRFFVLQAHYRSTLDFSNEALLAAEKGLERLMKGIDVLNHLKPSKKSTVDVGILRKKCDDAMNDDLNHPMAISVLFDGVRIINSVNDGKESVTSKDIDLLKSLYDTYVYSILGIRIEEQASEYNDTLLTGLINTIISLRDEAKSRKDFVVADHIRNRLTELGVLIRDTKNGVEWEIKK